MPGRKPPTAEEVKKFRAWLDEALPQVAPKGVLGEALQYLNKYWSKLVRYCEDGRLPIDNNRPGRSPALSTDLRPSHLPQGCGLWIAYSRPCRWLLRVRHSSAMSASGRSATIPRLCLLLTRC